MHSFIRKVLTRLRNIYLTVRKKNIHFRPARSCEQTREYVKENPALTYIKIFDAYHSVFKVIPELKQRTSRFVTTKDEYDVPEAFVVKIPNGRVHTDNTVSVAVIDDKNVMLGDASFQYKHGSIIAPSKNNIFKRRYFEEPMRVKGSVFNMLIGGSGPANFGHWIVDCLPRLHLLKKAGLYNEIDWFLLPSLKKRYQKESLDLIGLDTKKVIEGDEHPHIKADIMYASSDVRKYLHHPSWMHDFYNENIDYKNITEKVDAGDLIYVSRKYVQRRKILNEDKLVELLTHYGFKVVCAEEVTFRQQVKIFNQAKVVIFTHGSSLANLLFCKKGISVVELFPGSYIRPEFNDLSERIGIKYQFYISKPTTTSKSYKKGMVEDLLIDISEFKKVLETTLANR